MKVGCSINRRGGHLWFALAAMSCALSLFSSAAYGQPAQSVYDVVTAFDVPKGVAPYGELIRATDGNFYGTTSAGGAFGLGTVFKMDPAGTLTTLHSFKGEDGSNPRAGLIQAVDGSFYGTTESGGDGNENGPSQYKGTVFRIDAAGQLTTLHRFTYSDGISLNGGLIQGADGSFYGTARYGGSANGGTVFKLDAAGALTVLRNFDSSQDAAGREPMAGVTESDGSLYGTTNWGGAAGGGTIFRIDPSGGFTTVHSFGAGDASDGGGPLARLIVASDGNLYGTSMRGRWGYGTIFKINTGGALTLLTTFDGINAATPSAPLIEGSDGNFYGTTQDRTFGDGAGTVFRIDRAGNLTILYTFAPSTFPYAGLIQTGDGTLYGTTTSGGSPYGTGSIFKIDAAGIFTSLQDFNSDSGGSPYAGLIQANDGNFYGTTLFGGNADQGTVFTIDSLGTLATLHSFFGASAYPYASLAVGTDGAFYGTTASAFSDSGSVFKIGSSGAFSTLHSFSASGSAGSYPYAGLLRLSDGSFYGTTAYGGLSGYPDYRGHGAVFKIDTTGIVTSVHTFSDESHPFGGLIQATDGNFYGTTRDGGIGGGTVFKMDAAGNLTTLHVFGSIDYYDGYYPYGRLLQASDGNLYGTTTEGGTSRGGTIFRIDTAGRYTTLHSFWYGDGERPYAGLIQATDGNLYGTTAYGAYGYGTTIYGLSGYGMVFRLGLDGAFSIIHFFQLTDGAGPRGDLLQASDGNLYGTTSYGGPKGGGVVFRIVMPPVTTLSSSPNPSWVGQTVVLTARVSAGTSTPDGQVEFFEGSTSLGIGGLNNGTASINMPTLFVGSHSLTARYLGDVRSVSSPLTQVVTMVPTTLVVVSSPNPSEPGEEVTLMATVGFPPAGSKRPSGWVTFFDGGTSLGTDYIKANDSATLTTSALGVGPHSLTATYGGDAIFTGSSSTSALAHSVKWTTTTAVTRSANPSVFGQPVTLQASVSASAGTASGTVQFFDGGTSLGAATLSGGIATLTTGAFSVGVHQISAEYLGNAQLAGSTSSAINQTVNASSTTTTLTSAPNPSAAGQVVSFTATVSAVAPGAGTPTGTVTFLEGPNTLGTAVLNGGTATFMTGSLAGGTHDVTARYEGNTSFSTSSSTPVSQFVSTVALKGFAVPNSTSGCNNASGTVTLTSKAPAGGIVVTLVNTNPAASVPATVTVPGNATSASFPIATTASTTARSGVVTVSLGTVGFTKSLGVTAARLQSLVIDPATVNGGANATGTVSFGCVAGPDPVVITLSSSAASVAEPSVGNVTLPVGATSAGFSVTTQPVTKSKTVTIKATTEAGTISAALTVKP